MQEKIPPKSARVLRVESAASTNPKKLEGSEAKRLEEESKLANRVELLELLRGIQ
jgi:hypothetical protein